MPGGGADRARTSPARARPCRGCRCSKPGSLPSQRLDGARVFAFSGIARPAKFHATLQEAGAELAGYAAFPDHHRFTKSELDRVLSAATELGAMPITTPKDAVRLPDPVRAIAEVLGVRLEWADEAALDRLLDEVLR